MIHFVVFCSHHLPLNPLVLIEMLLGEIFSSQSPTHSGWHPPRLLRCILKGDVTQLPVWSYVISLEPHDVSFTTHCMCRVSHSNEHARPLKLLRPGFSWAGTPAQRVKHGNVLLRAFGWKNTSSHFVTPRHVKSSFWVILTSGALCALYWQEAAPPPPRWVFFCSLTLKKKQLLAAK